MVGSGLHAAIAFIMTSNDALVCFLLSGPTFSFKLGSWDHGTDSEPRIITIISLIDRLLSYFSCNNSFDVGLFLPLWTVQFISTAVLCA